MKTIKVAVTGGAGQIGYSLLFRMAAGEMFGKDVKVDLRLLELEKALPALKGVAMEIEDCAFPQLGTVSLFSDPQAAFEGADWALLVGSVPRKQGMERADLLKTNAGVFMEQGEALNKTASDDCKVFVVGNPCNTNAYIAKAKAPRLSSRNFFAMTMLDQNRAAAQLADKANVDVSEVSQLAIWGNHSLTQYPDFYHAQIKKAPVLEAIKDEQWLQTEFLQTVQKRGAEIIKARGSSSAASAAHAVIDTVRKLNSPTPEQEFFSVAVCSDGSYGIKEGLMFSFPVRSDGEQWTIVEGLQHNDFGQQKLLDTRKELEQEAELVSNLL